MSEVIRLSRRAGSAIRQLRQPLMLIQSNNLYKRDKIIKLKRYKTTK